LFGRIVEIGKKGKEMWTDVDSYRGRGRKGKKSRAAEEVKKEEEVENLSVFGPLQANPGKDASVCCLVKSVTRKSFNR
jgi:hypothetical protein